jgi:putative ABC transport system ATP-binding protein
LINQPEILLADEPTGNLDSHNGAEIIGLLASLHRELGTTLLIATHDTRVAACAPRIVDLLDGRVQASDRSA